MSSILDALKKLEEDKATRLAEEQAVEVPFHPDAAEADLIGSRKDAEAVSSHKLILAAVGFIALLVLLCVPLSVYIASKVIAKPSAPATVAAIMQPPVASTAAVAPVAIPPKQPEPTPMAPKKIETPVVPPKPTMVKAPQEVPVKETTPLPSMETLLAITNGSKTNPDTTVDTAATPGETLPDTAQESAEAPKDTAASGDLRKLPLLRPSDRIQFNLEGMQLNLLSGGTNGSPHRSAVINLNKVYVGEKIPGTRTTLIGVWSDGVAIEVVGSGERFFVLR